MAGASDKARFYLEQSIPELQELERKKIFTKAEITSIIKKRSDFEHKLNARGSSPSDYARYIEYEINLDSLRQKRAKRLGVKAGSHGRQKRILFILDRATRKFHGDIALWMQYLDYARNQGAFKKVSQVLTSVLRLHPTKPELWIYAANYAMDTQGDMTEARSYMQRGLRFCKQSKELWLEYAKLELIYLAKIAGRRHILGLDEERSKKLLADTAEDPDADMIALPAITAEDIDPSIRTDSPIDEEALRKLSSTPALSGAITIAIFDAAMDHFKDTQLGERFFNMAAEFDSISCRGKILQHIVDRLIALEAKSPSSLDCFIRQPLVEIDFTSVAFPRAVGSALSRLKSSMDDEAPLKLVDKTVSWLVDYLKEDELDADIRTVLSDTVSKMLSQYIAISKQRGGGSGDVFAATLGKIRDGGLGNLLMSQLPSALTMWPANKGLLELSEVASTSNAIA